MVPLAWATAMLLARFIDPWIPIALAAVIVSAAIVSAGRPDIRELFRPAPSRILIGLLGAAIMLAATYGLFPLVARSLPALASETGNLYARFLAGRSTVSILLFVIPVIVAEELMWRGAFQEWIAQRLPASRLAIIVLAAAGYAIAHLPLGSPLLAGIAFLCGLYWSALRSLTRSVVPSLIAHLAWDLALILVPLNR
jgi:membrane protease YdiL (CAAX protease family)